MRCDDAAGTLADLVDGLAPRDDAAAAHIGRCLRCQAELAQHSRMRRAAVQLRVQLADPGPDLLEEVLAAIGTAGQGRTGRSALHRHRAAYVAAATAATAAGAVLLASRTRRTRLSPTG